MEDKIKQEAMKQADDDWENNLQNTFKDQLNNCLLNELKNLRIQMNDLETSVKKHIDSLEKDFDTKFNNQISQLQLQQQENDKDNKKLTNNIPIENDDELRKIFIDLKTVQNPCLKNIILCPGFNPLINLILNCLINIKSLVSYYFNPKRDDKISGKLKNKVNILCPAFRKLFDHAWKGKLNEYSPIELHQILKKLMKENYNTQNPGYIFHFILFQLNEELRQDKINENMPNEPNIIFSREKVLELFKLRNHEAIKIQNTFYNIIEIEKRCQICGTISYSFEHLPIINIYLEAQAENIFNKISLLEHFRTLLTDKNEEKITEDCLACGSKSNKFISTDIIDNREVIIININRFNDPNNMVEFNYPEKIEKKNIINQSKSSVFDNYKYEIFCVLKQYKINNNFQYLLFCKSFVNNTWYSYNNQYIRKTDLKEATSDNKNTCLIIYKVV